MRREPPASPAALGAEAAGALRAQLGKVARQLDVLAHRQERQQVELLENIASVINTETIPSTRRQRGEFLAEQADAASAGLLHATQ